QVGGHHLLRRLPLRHDARRDRDHKAEEGQVTVAGRHAAVTPLCVWLSSAECARGACPRRSTGASDDNGHRTLRAFEEWLAPAQFLLEFIVGGVGVRKLLPDGQRLSE